MKEIAIAYIYPAPKEVLENIFERKDGYLIKYLSREPTKKTKTMATNVKQIFFYQSGGNKEIVGEAKVRKTQYCKAKEAKELFGNKLLIGSKRFSDYIKGREDRSLIVFEVYNSKIYPKPILAHRPITMAGQYLTKEEMKKFFK